MRAVVWFLIALSVLVSACLGESATLPPPAPPVACIGIPPQTCQQIVNDARANADPGTIPLQIRAVCTGSCTPASGDVQVDVIYSNNRRDSYGMGWSGAVDPAPGGPAPAEPSLPVEPTCTGVPAAACLEQAMAALRGDPPVDGAPPIVRIDVRCARSPCTETAGIGDTLITFADGTTSGSRWDYSGSTPAETPPPSPTG
jgi:hypothetical protein